MKKDYSTAPFLQKTALFKQRQLYPYFRSIESSDGPGVVIDDRRLINIGANNYLGLTKSKFALGTAAPPQGA